MDGFQAASIGGTRLSSYSITPIEPGWTSFKPSDTLSVTLLAASAGGVSWLPLYLPFRPIHDLSRLGLLQEGDSLCNLILGFLTSERYNVLL